MRYRMSILHNPDFKIHVLVFDYDRVLASRLSDILSKSGVCIPHQIDSIQDAQKKIDSSDRADVCVLEVFSDCVNEAAIGFIRSNIRKIACVVFTQSESAGLGARCIEVGAKKVVDKKNFDKDEFVNVVYSVACIHLINPGYNPKGSDTFDSATGILLEKCPESVTAWAELSGISDRQLRGLVKKNSKVSAKDALCLATKLKNECNFRIVK
jgi:DNA-binding NarL/FixJ family response regulator